MMIEGAGSGYRAGSVSGSIPLIGGSGSGSGTATLVFSKILPEVFVFSGLGFTTFYQGKKINCSNIAYFSEDERLKKTVRRLQDRVDRLIGEKVPYKH
jgi:hypothetical protein